MPELSAKNIQIPNLIGDALDAIRLKMRCSSKSDKSVGVFNRNNIQVVEKRSKYATTSAIREVDKLNRPKGLFVGSQGEIKAIVVRQSEKLKRVEVGTFKYELSSYIDEHGTIKKAQLNKLTPVSLEDCKIECNNPNNKIDLVEILDQYKDYQLIYM